MKFILVLIVIILSLSLPVSAMEFIAPAAPEDAQKFMPEDTESFGEGLWYIIKKAMEEVGPELVDASKVCLSLIAVVILLNIADTMSEKAGRAVRMTGAVLIGLILLEPTNTLVHLGNQAVTQTSEYGKLVVPVMTAALAAQGGSTSSAVLCTATVFFNTLLTSAITKLLLPMVNIYLCLSVANQAVGQQMLKSVQKSVKSLITWMLKCILYVFTGYISITGVVSGAVDASAIKAAKLAISGVVPVVGGILSDASEAVLVGAGVMKSAAGIYGILAVIAVCIGPFLQIGSRYLMMKLTAGICGIIGNKQFSDLIEDISSGMGLVLAMTGTVCLMLLISLVCFMRGVG
ncbi:MAG: stage III sporulation protein AE [Oscillospiraceae bacterium]|nr:stage III sporulation protein AE [Oscillospiraceae bacterium]MBQ4642542.1 stage III sporulation protein AE [Oscillospiraceae bacterium]